MPPVLFTHDEDPGHESPGLAEQDLAGLPRVAASSRSCPSSFGCTATFPAGILVGLSVAVETWRKDCEMKLLLAVILLCHVPLVLGREQGQPRARCRPRSLTRTRPCWFRPRTWPVNPAFTVAKEPPKITFSTLQRPAGAEQ